MSRRQLTVAVAVFASIGALGCTLTWAASAHSEPERFLQDDQDLPESIRALNAVKRQLYTKLPAGGVDGPFHGAITIGLAVVAALAASIAGSPSHVERPKEVRLMLNTSTVLLAAAFAITMWDCGHSVFDQRAIRATGIYVTLGALVLACLASAFAGTADTEGSKVEASDKPPAE